MPAQNLRILFPEDISQGSRGGPMWRTDAHTVDNGYRSANSPWDYPLHSYEAVYGVRRWPQLEALSAIFHLSRGELYDLLYKDPLDHKTCSVSNTPAFGDTTLIASAVGGEVTAQLKKTYLAADIDGVNVTYQRKITRPAYGALMGLNGIALTEGVDYTIDYNTGQATFGALSVGDALTWGGLFYVPVIFAADSLDHTLNNYLTGQTSVPLMEVRE